MRMISRIGAVALVCLLAMPGGLSLAAGAKKYQVTGVVLALTKDVITVQKGDEKWELNRDANTKVTGDLKVGGKVTIEYTMSAATVEVKDTGDTTKPKSP